MLRCCKALTPPSDATLAHPAKVAAKLRARND
jgi:hypothetical protein